MRYKVCCQEFKKRNDKKWFLCIYLYHILLHIAMKHEGKQGKSLGCKVLG